MQNENETNTERERIANDGLFGFEEWWDSIGSGITPKDGDDHEEHARRIAGITWKAATDAANER